MKRNPEVMREKRKAQYRQIATILREMIVEEEEWDTPEADAYIWGGPVPYSYASLAGLVESIVGQLFDLEAKGESRYGRTD